MTNQEIAQEILKIQTELPGGSYTRDGIDITANKINFITGVEGDFELDISITGMEMNVEGFDENDDIIRKIIDLRSMIYDEPEKVEKLLTIIKEVNNDKKAV